MNGHVEPPADALRENRNRIAEKRRTFAGMHVSVTSTDGLLSDSIDAALSAELRRLLLREAPRVGDTQSVFCGEALDLASLLYVACHNLGIPNGMHSAKVTLGDRSIST